MPHSILDIVAKPIPIWIKAGNGSSHWEPDIARHSPPGVTGSHAHSDEKIQRSPLELDTDMTPVLIAVMPISIMAP
jgi:hypothetical protein